MKRLKLENNNAVGGDKPEYSNYVNRVNILRYFFACESGLGYSQYSQQDLSSFLKLAIDSDFDWNFRGNKQRSGARPLKVEKSKK